MAVRQIYLNDAPVLRQVAAPVTSFDETLADLIRDMFETMYDAPGRGLAAPQIGESKRAFVVDTAWKEGDPAPMLFVNPQITAQSETVETGTEACLSIPGVAYDVARPTWVEMSWQDLDGAPHTGRFEGVTARCVLHENDHLDGVLIPDHGVMQ